MGMKAIIYSISIIIVSFLMAMGVAHFVKPKSYEPKATNSTNYIYVTNVNVFSNQTNYFSLNNIWLDKDWLVTLSTGKVLTIYPHCFTNKLVIDLNETLKRIDE